MTKYGVSMFSGGGVADLGFEVNGIRFIASNELLHDRAALLRLNHPKSEVFVGDAWKCYDEIISFTKGVLNGNQLFLLFTTPPCQGMSPNGAGTLLRNIRKGLRPKLDPRNRLVMPALKVACSLKPEWIVFENVPNMKNTMILDENQDLVNILDLIEKTLDDGYLGKAYEVEFADYGLPQRRKRLITVFTRNRAAKDAFSSGYDLIPPRLHDKEARGGLKPWVTVRHELMRFEKLDAGTKETAKSKKDPLHRVPVLDSKKYFWVKHTLPNSSAFDNQCINPECLYQENPKHGTKRNSEGINQARKDTPLYCLRCGALLPRPYTEKNGKLRIMFGYTSAYKRMDWDLPATTITRNFPYPCSDSKLHPEENRVMSFSEAAKLQSISDYGYKWGPVTVRGKTYQIAPDTLIRNVIGEAAPPLFFDALCKWILKLSSPISRRLLARQYTLPECVKGTVGTEF